MRFAMVRLFFVVIAGSLVAGCGNHTAENPEAAQQTYGISVSAADAIPVAAVVADLSRYEGRRISVDGRIAKVSRNGCRLYLENADGPTLRVDAARTENGTCAWQVPLDTEGFAVAAGTLRSESDTLHLAANGLQITPARLDAGDS